VWEATKKVWPTKSDKNFSSLFLSGAVGFEATEDLNAGQAADPRPKPKDDGAAPAKRSKKGEKKC
jgi:hypothetical protein